jgi:hypothetical protein
MTRPRFPLIKDADLATFAPAVNGDASYTLRSGRKARAWECRDIFKLISYAGASHEFGTPAHFFAIGCASAMKRPAQIPGLQA